MTQVADLKGGLQAVLRQAPGLSANCCIANQDVQGPVGGGTEGYNMFDRLLTLCANKEDATVLEVGFYTIFCQRGGKKRGYYDK